MSRSRRQQWNGESRADTKGGDRLCRTSQHGRDEQDEVLVYGEMKKGRVATKTCPSILRTYRLSLRLHRKYKRSHNASSLNYYDRGVSARMQPGGGTTAVSGSHCTVDIDAPKIDLDWGGEGGAKGQANEEGEAISQRRRRSPPGDWDAQRRIQSAAPLLYGPSPPAAGLRQR